MGAKLNGNGVSFPDGSNLPTAKIPWNNFVGHPTNLSQFTNDLGNYGGFLTTANVVDQKFADPNGVIWGWHRTSGQWSLTWDGAVIGLRILNCNCACNC
jgi:hypothetical protein